MNVWTAWFCFSLFWLVVLVEGRRRILVCFFFVLCVDITHVLLFFFSYQDSFFLSIFLLRLWAWGMPTFDTIMPKT